MQKVEVTTQIKTTPATVISAFTNVEMLKEWWGVERALIEIKEGGIYTLAWNISSSGFGYVSTGRINTHHPKKLLVIDNFVYLNPDKPFLGPMTLTVKVKKKGEMTELYLCQDGYQRGPDWSWYYEAVKEAWPAVIQQLKNYLENNL